MAQSLTPTGQPPSPGNETSPNGLAENLGRLYWWPVYAYVRRQGFEAGDAQSLAQKFLTQLLGADLHRVVACNRGMFRSLLLATLQHFLAWQRRRPQTQYERGRFMYLAAGTETELKQYPRALVTKLATELRLDEKTVATLLQLTLHLLRVEFDTAGKSACFEAIKMFLIGEEPPASYAELAVQLGMSEAALKTTVSRMRQRFGELLRDLSPPPAAESRSPEIAARLDDPTEIIHLQPSAPGNSLKQEFERDWAMALLRQVIERLRGEFVADGKELQFEATKIFLTGEKRATAYPELARNLEMTAATLKAAVSRMRLRYGELLRWEIANTVSSAEEVDEELRAWLAALG